MVHFVVEKEGRHIAVLTKHYRRNVSSRLVEKIARSAPLRLPGGTADHQSGLYFGSQELANSLGVDLWNRDRIIDLLLALRRRGK